MIQKQRFFSALAIAGLSLSQAKVPWGVSTIEWKPTEPQERQRRHLQELEKFCGKSRLLEYQNEQLGPSASSRSKYNTVYLDSSRLAYLPMGLLTFFEFIGKFRSVPFVQEDEFLGRNGEHTEELFAQHEMLQDFWKIRDHVAYKPILLAGLHSEQLETTLPDAVETMIDLLAETGAVSNSLSGKQRSTREAREAIEQELPKGYSNPALSAATLFAGGIEEPASFPGSPVILIGDGTLDYADSLGLGDNAADFFHAHEFAHVIFFQLELENNNLNVDKVVETFGTKTPSFSRKIELEADAMAAYALSHDKGGNMTIPDLLEVVRLAGAVGDRLFDDAEHHGTQAQRECAARWGADEGILTMEEPMSMREFHELFRENLGAILELDPTVCKFAELGELEDECALGSTGATIGGALLLLIALGIVAGVVACMIMCGKKKTTNEADYPSVYPK